MSLLAFCTHKEGPRAYSGYHMLGIEKCTAQLTQIECPLKMTDRFSKVKMIKIVILTASDCHIIRWAV